MSRYVKKRTITSNVWIATDTTTEETVVIKRNRDESREEIPSEVRVSDLVKHENIVSCLNYYFWEGCHHVVLEYIDGMDLFEYMENRDIQFQPLKEEWVRRMMRQLIDALMTLHAAGIYHLDIKLENVILLDTPDRDRDPKIKLIDFDLCQISNQRYATLDSSSGSAEYASPDVFLKIEDCPAEKADVFCLGTLLYILVTGEMPFHTTEKLGLLLRERRLPRLVFREQVCLTEQVKELISGMLKMDHRERLNMLTVRESAWMNMDDAVHSTLQEERS